MNYELKDANINKFRMYNALFLKLFSTRIDVAYYTIVIAQLSKQTTYETL